MDKKDLIISAYTGYDWSKIKFWANSIDRCGFKGDRAMIVYNSDPETVQRLVDLGFSVVAFAQDPVSKNFYWPGQQLVVVVQRFYNFWNYLDQIPDDRYRFVITTDCKDVIFQQDPSKWLEENIGNHSIVASSESLLYRNEPWGNDNLMRSYPMLHARMKNVPIWNCGVQAGRQREMKELWLNIWMLCHAGMIHNPDQAAYNVLLGTRAWESITKFTMSESGWAAQLGTTMDPLKINGFAPHLLEPVPMFDGNLVKTSNGNVFTVVHQYDRIPEIKSIFEKIYK